MCSTVWAYVDGAELALHNQSEMAALLRVNLDSLPLNDGYPVEARGPATCLCPINVEAAFQAAGYRVEWDPFGFNVFAPTETPTP